jgi:hypothetical protein
MHEMIPLQILDPFTELFEVGHTLSAHGSDAQIVVSAFVNRNFRLEAGCFFPCQCRRIELATSGFGVRRAKAALSSGGRPHPATAPAGSNRSSHGGNEVAEAFA